LVNRHAVMLRNVVGATKDGKVELWGSFTFFNDYNSIHEDMMEEEEQLRLGFHLEVDWAANESYRK
jgi:hypothetical protein